MCSTAGEHAILWTAEKRREGAQESKIARASKATIEPLQRALSRACVFLHHSSFWDTTHS